jgi:Pyrimidine operon attenuation protein/uracil phosphoribosyltransferase
MSTKNYVLTAEQVSYKLHRLALEVAEHLQDEKQPLIIIGVLSKGIVIAEKLGALLKPYINIPVEIISASLDKDVPVDITLSKNIDFNNKNVLIVDDVANNGKTLLYVLKPLLQFHPKRIQTLVLVERMHKLFPIKPDYVGLSVATTLQDHIQVEVQNGEVAGAYVI